MTTMIAHRCPGLPSPITVTHPERNASALTLYTDCHGDSIMPAYQVPYCPGCGLSAPLIAHYAARERELDRAGEGNHG